MMRTGSLEQLIGRVAAGLGPRVTLEIGGSGFSYEASNDRLLLRGEDQVAVAAALHHYSTRHLDQRYTWSHPFIEIPDRLPDAPTTRRDTELEHRYYLNFVTYGYTMAFWDWQRWEQEIDWMALHSINRPLMTIGHEAVLVETFRRLGLSEEAALGWVGSAAHLPWMFMGGINSWGGPVSPEYLGNRLDLARKAVARMRELGMRPVLPGFNGQIPTQLADPDSTSIEWQGWRTPFLDPAGVAYRTAAEVFYEVQHGHLGSDHLYAIDPFIESVPPTEDSEWLTSAGAGIHRALHRHDPLATWVLQAWPFHYQKQYWTRTRAEAFMAAVPRERLILLDLWAEFAPLWEKSDGMFGREWLWCAVHNYGGRFALFGDLEGTIDMLDRARHSPARGELNGLGFTMEATENNEVYYELLADQVWGRTPLEPWLEQWSRTRYRTSAAEAHEVWRILSSTLYAPGRARSIPSPVIARPWNDEAPFATQRLAGEALTDIQPQTISANIDAENDTTVLDDLVELVRACELLLGLPDSPERDQDLQEILIHVVAQHARYAIRAVLLAYRQAQADDLREAADSLATHIEWLDELAATRAASMVGTWLAAARASATRPDEAERFEFDARSLITVWGRQDSGLHDYSGRHWSGLLSDFYRPRWRMWTDWLAAGAEDLESYRARIVHHEEAWRAGHGHYPTQPTQTITEVARHVLNWLATSDMEPISNKGERS